MTSTSIQRLVDDTYRLVRVVKDWLVRLFFTGRFYQLRNGLLSSTRKFLLNDCQVIVDIRHSCRKNFLEHLFALRRVF